MELADMQDLGSCVFDVQVQVLSSAPPRRSKLYIACSDFLYKKSERTHAAAPPLPKKGLTPFFGVTMPRTPNFMELLQVLMTTYIVDLTLDPIRAPYFGA